MPSGSFWCNVTEPRATIKKGVAGGGGGGQKEEEKEEEEEGQEMEEDEEEQEESEDSNRRQIGRAVAQTRLLSSSWSVLFLSSASTTL